MIKKLPLKAYIWDIETLKKWIINGWLTQKNKLIFFLLLSCINMLLASTPKTYIFSPFYLVFLHRYMPVLILAIAIIIAYINNGGKEGNNFIERFVMIDWIVFVRICIFFTIPIIIIFYFGYKNLSYQLWIKVRIIIVLIVNIYAYWRICDNFRDLRQKELKIQNIDNKKIEE
jgi:hypothetical protein